MSDVPQIPQISDAQLKRIFAQVDSNGLGPDATVIGKASNLWKLAIESGASQELIDDLFQHGNEMVRVKNRAVTPLCQQCGGSGTDDWDTRARAARSATAAESSHD